MNKPDSHTIVKHCIKLMLSSMDDIDNSNFISVKENLALAVLLLNQITELTNFNTIYEQTQFDFCRKRVLGK